MLIPDDDGLFLPNPIAKRRRKWRKESHTFFNGQSGCFCCPNPCGNNCGDTPTTYTVTLSGFTNGTCTQCTSLNGTFIGNGNWANNSSTIAYQENCISPFISTAICSGGAAIGYQLSLVIYTAFSNTIIDLNVGASTVATNGTWRATIGPTSARPYTCTSLGTLTLPRVLLQSPGACFHDGSSATVTIG